MAIYANENGVIRDLTEKTDYTNGLIINGIKYFGTRTSDNSISIPDYTNYKYIVLIPLHIKSDTTVRVPVIIKVEDMSFELYSGQYYTNRNIGWNYSVNAGRGGAYIKLTKDNIDSTTVIVQSDNDIKYGVFGVY